MKNVYKIKIDDDECYMDAISLVDFPAVNVNFLKFNYEEKPVYHSFNDEKHIITGVVCLADTPIYRHNVEYGDYYVVFEKETILKMVEKYSKMNMFNQINIQHDDNNFVDDIVLIESYIINDERGIRPIEFKNVPNGSWLCSFKVNNDEVWEQIKNKELRGFSLQGMFNLEKLKLQKTNIIKELSMIFDIKLRNLILRFMDVVTDKGTITIDGEMKVGATVYINDEIATDGDYETEKEVIKVVNGVIEEIIEKKEEEEIPTEVEPTTEEVVIENEVEPTIEETKDDSEIEDLKNKITELEGLLENRDAIIAELTAKLEDAESKLKMSVEKLASQVRNENKTIYSFLKK